MGVVRKRVVREGQSKALANQLESGDYDLGGPLPDIFHQSVAFILRQPAG